MSPISLDDVKKLAALSALTLHDDELVAMQTDLKQILAYVTHLSDVETDGVEPTYQVHSLETVVRHDEVIDYGISQAELLKNVPEKHDGLVVVPKVMA